MDLDAANIINISGILEKDGKSDCVLRLVRQKDAVTPVKTKENPASFLDKHVILKGKFVSEDMKDGGCLSYLLADKLKASDKNLNSASLTVTPVSFSEKVDTTGGGFYTQRAKLADGNGYITITSSENLGLVIGETYTLIGRIKAKTYKKYSSLSLQIKEVKN